MLRSCRKSLGAPPPPNFPSCCYGNLCLSLLVPRLQHSSPWRNAEYQARPGGPRERGPAYWCRLWSSQPPPMLPWRPPGQPHQYWLQQPQSLKKKQPEPSFAPAPLPGTKTQQLPQPASHRQEVRGQKSRMVQFLLHTFLYSAFDSGFYTLAYFMT